jgi:hypothetical protein
MPFLPGTPTPFSPEEFFQPPQVQPPKLNVDEDSHGWWAGVFLCGALLIPPAVPPPHFRGPVYQGSSATQLDEDFPGPVPSPVPLTFIVPQQWLFDVQEPAGNLHGQPDEDFPGPVPAPVQLTFIPSPNWQQDDPAGSLYVLPDESQWVSPPPWPLTNAKAFTDDDVTVTAVVPLPPDEDFWQNWVPPVPLNLSPPHFRGPIYSPVAGATAMDEDFPGPIPPPVPLTFIVPQQWIFDVQEPAGSLHGQPDEDFPGPFPAPVPLTFLWPSPAWHQDDPALYVIPDESQWTPPLQWPLTNARPFTDDEVIVPQPVAFTPDEDYWQNLLQPSVGTLLWPNPWFHQDDPAGSLSGQPDEDFPGPVPPPVQLTFLWPQQWTFDVQEPAGSLYVIPDESQWTPPSPWAVISAAAVTDDEVIVPQPVVFQPEEEFWSVAQPWPLIWQWPQPGSFDPVDLTFLYTDEDYWQQFTIWTNWVRPLPLSFGDSDGVLPTVDEDFWPQLLFPQLPLNTWSNLAFQAPADEIIVPQPTPLNFDEEFFAPLLPLNFWSYIMQQWTYETVEWPTPPPPPVLPVTNVLRWGAGSRMMPPYSPK